jgi:hypothetical protein
VNSSAAQPYALSSQPLRSSLRKPASETPGTLPWPIPRVRGRTCVHQLLTLRLANRPSTVSACS